jgi:hypothetical protein
MTAQTAATLAQANARTAAARDPANAGFDYSFFDSVRDIMNIQAVCEVQNILSLVRSSIHQASPVATISPGGQISTVVPPTPPIITLPPAVPGPIEIQHRASLELLLPQLPSLSFNQLQVMLAMLPSPNASTNPKVVGLAQSHPQFQTNANQARELLREWPFFDDTIVDRWVGAFDAAKKSPK